MLTTSGPWASSLVFLSASCLVSAYAMPVTQTHSFHRSNKGKINQAKSKHLSIDWEPLDLNLDISFVIY